MPTLSRAALHVNVIVVADADETPTAPGALGARRSALWVTLGAAIATGAVSSCTRDAASFAIRREMSEAPVAAPRAVVTNVAPRTATTKVMKRRRRVVKRLLSRGNSGFRTSATSAG